MRIFTKKNLVSLTASFLIILIIMVPIVTKGAPEAKAVTETFTTEGDTSWQAPTGVTSVQVEVWGAGGGGAGSAGSGSAGGGGGGGGYSKDTSVTVTPGNSYTVRVGAKGTAGSGNTTHGGVGGDSWFIDATTVMAKGGNGGQHNGVAASNAAGGAAGSGIGDTKFSGGQGGSKGTTNGGGGGGGGGDAADGSAGTNGASGNTGGSGGSSGGGAGGNGGLGSSASQNGSDGTQPGGGGGGGTFKNGTNTTGGAGGAGKVVITYTAVSNPDKIAFSNASRTLVKGACNGAANVFTMELQAGSTPTNPQATTVVRVTSNSDSYTIYSDSSCSVPVTNGDFTFTTSENTKSVYIIDNSATNGTKTLTGTRQSGDTLTTGTQDYTLESPPVRIKGGNNRFRGGTRIK